MLGLIVAAPPLSADVKWRSALESQDASKVVSSLDSSLFNPVNSQQLNQAIQLFMGSNLTNEAREAALREDVAICVSRSGGSKSKIRRETVPCIS